MAGTVRCGGWWGLGLVVSNTQCDPCQRAAKSGGFKHNLFLNLFGMMLKFDEN